MKTDELRQQLEIPRNLVADLGRQAIRISTEGEYVTPSGAKVLLRPEVEHAVQNTESYPPEREVPAQKDGNVKTIFETANETTLSGARRLTAEGLRPAVLNMASASSPGGGFLHGARAQEEYLCRSSALYLCLENNKMYSHPDAHNAFGTDWVIYSPDVPVFRDDNGRLLDRAEHFSILTCAAVNANGVQKYLPHRSGDIGPVMLKRMSKLLRVAALQHHDSLVLGAWGCGAFGNDGQLIARLFRETFQSEVRGIFTRVVFSITDWSADLKFIGPFKTIFA